MKKCIQPVYELHVLREVSFNQDEKSYNCNLFCGASGWVSFPLVGGNLFFLLFFCAARGWVSSSPLVSSKLLLFFMFLFLFLLLEVGSPFHWLVANFFSKFCLIVYFYSFCAAWGWVSSPLVGGQFLILICFYFLLLLFLCCLRFGLVLSIGWWPICFYLFIFFAAWGWFSFPLVGGQSRKLL